MLAVVFAPLLASAQPGGADTITLVADRDNTIYDVPLADVSNGEGDHLFTGVTGADQARRCLVRFDVAGSLPVGATITSARLLVEVDKVANNTPRDVSLHRVTADWGEGASDAIGEEGIGAFAEPGDATWAEAFFPDVDWAAEGGDFSTTASAVLPVDVVGAYAFPSTGATVGDVQGWLLDPSSNFGWILVGDESVGSTAKRLSSRENPNAAAHPRLEVEFDPCPAVPASEIVRAGSPANPVALAPGQSSSARIGAVWDPRIEHATFVPDAILDLLVVTAGTLEVPTEFGTLLCDVAGGPVWFGAAPGQTFAVEIPGKCSLAGAQLCAQGASVSAGGSVALTNALDVTIGS